MKRLLRVSNREIEIFSTTPSCSAPLVVVTVEAGEGEAVFGELSALTERDFALASIIGVDWNAELSPWPAPAAFKGGGAFAGGADAYLEELTGALLPEVLGALAAPPTFAALGGYSLAGLFALYALYRTTAFDRAASASGSLWYPGFLDYAGRAPLARAPRGVYLSVGDREGRTRNPILRSVEENTRALADLYARRGIPVRFELNPGNHFDHPQRRLARAIAWVLEQD